MSEKRTRQLRRIQRTSVIGSIVAVIAIFTALAASTLGIERATQLAAIPPTLTELAGQIHVSETSVASLQLAADALSFVTNLRLGQDSGISYVEVTGPIWLRSNYDDIENLVFRCQLWSEQAGFQVYLHEGTQGAIFLNFQSGNLIVTQQGTTTQIQVANIYSRGRWLKFVVFLIDGRLVVYTDERLQLNQSLQGSSDAGSIILAAQAADTFRIGQDCFDTLTDEQHASSVEQAIRDMGTNFPLH